MRRNIVQDQMAGQTLLAGTRAAALEEFERADGSHLGGLHGDMDAMCATPRPVGRQTRRAGDSGSVRGNWIELPRSQERAHGHCPSCGFRTELLGLRPQPLAHRHIRVGNHGLEHNA